MPEQRRAQSVPSHALASFEQERALARAELEAALTLFAVHRREPTSLEALGPDDEPGPVEVQYLGALAVAADEHEQVPAQHLAVASLRSPTRSAY